MKVSEAISKLREFPGDALVCVMDSDPDFKVRLFIDVLEVERAVDSSGQVVALFSVEEL
jgi:hypothetical protein